jgi:hypothetical protein
MNGVKAVALTLVALGAVSFFLAAVFANMDFGSCPALPPGVPPCDHIFAGTSIYIGPVVKALEVLGTIAIGFGAGLLVLSRHSKQTKPDIESSP